MSVLYFVRRVFRYSRVTVLRSNLYLGLLLLGALLLWGIHSIQSQPGDLPKATSVAAAPAAHYVGVPQCVACHAKQVTEWKGSHHELSMQHANADTVLGDFSDNTVRVHGGVSTFFRRNGQYFARTDGPDGMPHDYQIKYTLGVAPLQQYLVELPGGRLQALSIAWDSRSKDQGGQKWFHLYPQEKIDSQDELHWSKLSQNWNHMCADCHSTNVKKNFDIVTNHFATEWSEINVACEACHGPASQHLTWASKKPDSDMNKGLQFLFDERKGITWDFIEGKSTAHRSAARVRDREIDTCARCHSRRSALTQEYQHGKALMDTHLPALLTEPNYYPDGQIKEEDYEYGSFVQSKMYQNGVTCSDCHNPHTLQLRAPGNQTCLQCHQETTYDTPTHHFHAEDSTGARCAECHMPVRNFMRIDGRHDHSIRIPRPDLSEKMHTPNACVGCHTGKTAAWASKQMQTWYGTDWSRKWHYGETLFEAAQGSAHAGQELTAVASSPQLPSIARATAVTMLPAYLDRATFMLLPKLLHDPSSLVRAAALDVVDQIPAEQRWVLAEALLHDPILAVRTKAAFVLAVVPRDGLTQAEQQSLDRAVLEYASAQQVTAEHPQSHTNIGLLYARLSDFKNAEHAYHQALALQEDFLPAYINLADLYRMWQDEQKVKETLLKARGLIGDNADIEHALGLHYLRMQKMPDALLCLEKAATLRPTDARYGYVFAVALHSAGQTQRAVTVLEKVYAHHPTDTGVIVALIAYSRSLGEMGQASSYAHKLIELDARYGTVDELMAALQDNG